MVRATRKKQFTWKRILRSRTLMFALSLAVFGAVESQMSLLQPLMNERLFGLFCVGISVIVATLRLITVTGLGETDEK